MTDFGHSPYEEDGGSAELWAYERSKKVAESAPTDTAAQRAAKTICGKGLVDGIWVNRIASIIENETAIEAAEIRRQALNEAVSIVRQNFPIVNFQDLREVIEDLEAAAAPAPSTQNSGDEATGD